MKTLTEHIKENNEVNYKKYTCYFSGRGGADYPNLLFGSAFVEEYIFKLAYSENAKKTNETEEGNKSNFEDAVDIITPKGTEIDVKRTTRKNINSPFYIRFRSKILEKNRLIGVILKNKNDNDYPYLLILEPDKIKNKLSYNNGFYYLYDDDMIKLNSYIKKLPDDLANKYIELEKTARKINDIPPIPKNADISVFKKAADTFLKRFSPVFIKCFNMVPEIKFKESS